MDIWEKLKILTPPLISNLDFFNFVADPFPPFALFPLFGTFLYGSPKPLHLIKRMLDNGENEGE